jgi:hypothetical protein
VYLRIIAHAKPAELVVALVAGHVIAPTVLLDRGLAFRTWINQILLLGLDVEFIQRTL